jgi:hypothetical protein
MSPKWVRMMSFCKRKTVFTVNCSKRNFLIELGSDFRIDVVNQEAGGDGPHGKTFPRGKVSHECVTDEGRLAFL